MLLPCIAVFTFPIIETLYYLACPHPKSGALYIAALHGTVRTECLSSLPCGKLTSAHHGDILSFSPSLSLEGNLTVV